MEKLIRKRERKEGKKAIDSTSTADGNEDVFEELNRWFKTKRLDHAACPNPISWWGVCTPISLDSPNFDG